MFNRGPFPRDLFAELDRLQREMQQASESSPRIRGSGCRAFSALNVGGRPQAVELNIHIPKAAHAQPRKIETCVE